MNEQIFFLGVVENREDPLKLGRCKIRVIGVHTPSKVDLPTSGLPWATPVQPVTSAAMNGIGTSPTGPVEGTWCLVIFTDPESKQQPMFLGTIGGIPIKPSVFNNDSEQATGNDDDGYSLTTQDPNSTSASTDLSKLDNLSAPAPVAQTLGQGIVRPTPAKGDIGQLSSSQLDNLEAVIRQRESSNNYKAVNSLGFVGAYQFGAPMLEDLGYVKKGTWAKYKRNSILDDSSVWTGKGGATSKQAFLNNNSTQDQAIRDSLGVWYNRMERAGYAGEDTPPARLGGLLMVSHLKGTGKGGVRDFVIGKATPDGYGTSPTEYYNLGYSSVEKKIPPTIPSKTSDQKLDNLDSSIAGQTDVGNKSVCVNGSCAEKGNPSTTGFIDPNLKYPLNSHVNEADTHRLARHEKINKTIVAEKRDNRELKVSMANTAKTWDQPPIPYNAKYPKNHVTTTESGHVIELDDTPGSERIHIYHNSGTFIEIDNAGTRVDRVSGTRCTIVEQDDLVYVKGIGSITVDGEFSVDVKKALHIEVHQDVKLVVHGNVQQDVTGNYNISCENFSLHARGEHKVISDGSSTHKAQNYHLKALNDVKTQADSTMHMLASGNVNVQGSLTYINSGTAQPASEAENPPPASCGWKIKDNKLVYEMDQWTPKLFEHNIDCANFQEIRNCEASDSSCVGSCPPKPAANSPTADPSSIDSEDLKNFDLSKANCPASKLTKPVIEMPITKATRLSQNFTLDDLCKDDPKGGSNTPVSQHGLTADQIVSNLQTLCTQVLEPVLAKFPDLKINDGFRLAGSKTSTAKGVSRHELGLAVDLGLKGAYPGLSKRNSRLALAKYITDTLALPIVHKVLLEFTTEGWAWVHVQINGETGSAPGNFPAGSNIKETVLNHIKFKPGFDVSIT